MTPEIGFTINRITVIESPYRQGKYNRLMVRYRCDCGTVKTAAWSDIRSGAVKSCGCWKREVTTARNTTHGDAHTRLYYTWQDMRRRCYDPANEGYKSYGGRGISVCDAWNSSYVTFREWAISHGYQDNLTIDRKDVDGDYEPDNCQFITLAANQRNRRTCRFVAAFGETKTVIEWSEDPRCRVRYDLLHQRIFKLHWPPEKALTQPSGGKYHAKGKSRK